MPTFNNLEALASVRAKINTAITQTEQNTIDIAALVSSPPSVPDGDKGDVIVSGGGTVWTLDPTASSLVNKQPLTTVLTNTTASYTLAEQTKLAAIAAGATANSLDAVLLARANHTGTQSVATITGLGTLATQSGTFSGTSSGTNTGDQTSIVGITGTKAQFNTAATDGDFLFVGDAPTAHTHLLSAVTDVTVTAANLNTLDDGVDTTLHFHAADRARANHTGTQAAATITGLATVATSGSAADLSAGILPAARFDDTAHGARAGGTLHANVVAAGAAGFMTGADKTKLDGIAAGAQVNVATDLSYTASTRLLASSTGADVTLPLVTSTDAGLAPASGGGTTNFLRADGTWVAPSGGGGLSDGDKGDVTVSGSGTVWAIDAGVVTNTKLATMPANTIKGNNTGSVGAPADLIVSDVKTLLAYTASDLSLAAVATSGSAADLTSGLLPPAQFNNTTHGSRSGGTLHAVATTGLAGFMSATDKTKLDSITTITTNGVAVLNFGAGTGSNTSTVVVTGQTAIGTSSKIKVWFMSVATAHHNADEHGLIFPSRVGLSAGNIVAGVGFTIYAETELQLTGDVSVCWEWN